MMLKRTLSLGSDHGGFELKETLKTYLNHYFPHIQLLDLGTHSIDSCHYPEFADRVAKSILSRESQLGILCCGTGIGISIRANRHKGIRAALVHDIFTATQAKAHNNANILCLGGRSLDHTTATQCVSFWLNTEFEAGRHQFRLDLLDQ